MMPFSEINLHDVYSNPMHRDYGSLSGLEYVVVEKNESERLVKVQPVAFSTGKPFGKPMWKKSSDRMFSEAWRVSQGMAV